jgi:hypothetical protein
VKKPAPRLEIGRAAMQFQKSGRISIAWSISGELTVSKNTAGQA